MPGPANVSLKLWVVLNRAVQTIGERLRRQVEQHGLSFTEFGVLEVLLHKGALPIGEIGDRVLLTSGSMTYVIDKLQKRGLLRRRACEADRRVIYAELTEAGQALMQTVFPEHAALIGELMQGLRPEEQEAATDLLKRLGLYAQAQAVPGDTAA